MPGNWNFYSAAGRLPGDWPDKKLLFETFAQIIISLVREIAGVLSLDFLVREMPGYWPEIELFIFRLREIELFIFRLREIELLVRFFVREIERGDVVWGMRATQQIKGRTWSAGAGLVKSNVSSQCIWKVLEKSLFEIEG